MAPDRRQTAAAVAVAVLVLLGAGVATLGPTDTAGPVVGDERA